MTPPPATDGVTLTISQVEGWNPDELTTASKAIDKLYGDLDNTVKTSTDNIEGLHWDGTAAAAAKTRMDLEKARASAISHELMGLGTAFNQFVGQLNGAKASVLAARNKVVTMPLPSGFPPFEIADNGVVSAQKQLDWYGQHRGKLNDAEFKKLTTQIQTDAANHTTEIVNALRTAQDTAESAVKAVNAAKAKVDAAYDKLGDPKLGVTASPAPSNTVNPAALTDNSTTPHYQTVSDSDNGTQYNNATYSDSGDESKLEKPSGNVAQWIAQAREILIQEGVPANEIDDNALATIIEHESGGNPEIINKWDSNYLAGHPSKGLMQTIDSTFNAWAVPGHTDIMNPVDNIVSASRYAIHRYGSLSNVPGVVAVRHGEAYVGY